jgi:signal peptidase I
VAGVYSLEPRVGGAGFLCLRSHLSEFRDSIALLASTLLVGDHVLVDRLAIAPASSWAKFMPYREVQRGDIVVFYKPAEEPDGEHLILVKRVIGVPGDRIHLRNGFVYLDGAAKDDLHAAFPIGTIFPRLLPQIVSA